MMGEKTPCVHRTYGEPPQQTGISHLQYVTFIGPLSTPRWIHGLSTSVLDFWAVSGEGAIWAGGNIAEFEVI